MKQFEEFLDFVRTVLIRSSEILGLFVSFLILVYLLLGEASGPYVIGVIDNIVVFVIAITPQSLIAIAILIGIYVFWKNKN